MKYMYMYLEHHVAKDVVREHFSFSTLRLEVVMKLPDNMCHRLSSSLGESGLVFSEEGVQINLLKL